MANNVFDQLDFEKLNYDPFEDILLNNLSDDNLNIFLETQMSLIKTPYFDPYEFKIKKDLNSFSVLHLNIRSMRQPRGSNKKGGGLGVYVLKKYQFKIKKQLSVANNNYESLFIEVINAKNKNSIIGCVYRPHSGKIRSFQDFIEKSILKTNNEKKKLFILGDINLNALTYQKFPKTKSFFDMLYKYNVLSVINKPTRVNRTSATAIDNIFINNLLETSFEAGIFKTDISDHFPIYITIKNIKVIPNDQPKILYINKRNLSTHSKNNLTNKLYLENWSDVFKSQNANEACNLFLDKFQEIFNEACPNELDTKKTWAVINGILGKNKDKTSSLPKRININNNDIFCPKEISKEFNTYFTNVGLDLANKITTPLNSYKTYLTPSNDKTLYDFDLTLKEFETAFSSIKNKNSSGFDGIPSNILISNKKSISRPLFYIVKLSLGQGIFPDVLKLAKVIPVYKNNDHANVSNYRPISLLSVFSKIFERVIYNRIFDHLTKNNFFYPKQFGFQKNLSTEHAIIELVDQINNGFNENKFTLGIFIDLTKAFDTVDHSILLEKLKYYGVINKDFNWIKSYLTDRTQYVHKKEYGILKLPCGVPQGSILGPLLFLVYINDLSNASVKLNPIMFADDTNLFLSNYSIKQLYADMNFELNKINDWFQANKLSLNVKKTKYTLFNKKSQEVNLPLKLPDLFLNNKEIKQEDSLKFLGILVDKHLSWLPHIKYLQSKMQICLQTVFVSLSSNRIHCRKLTNRFLCIEAENIGMPSNILQLGEELQ
ncbi:uncharacterized protein LOC136090057 [Hydra vulgaris]|uniref:Uncharacterized protein LOC136090057 n=1 Tax=Hydra vulgaris TaxID=6087 RepID=A0ABM4DCV3_HYDVU